MKEYLIDTHAHIDMLEAPIESTLQLMKDFGVKKAVIPSVEVSSMEKVIAAAEADENIYAMIGIYPSEAKTYTQEVEDRMIELAKNHKVKAVGEIGLVLTASGRWRRIQGFLPSERSGLIITGINHLLICRRRFT